MMKNKKILYIDCPMGAAGDMLTGALFALSEHRDETLKELNGMSMPGIRYVAEEMDSHGISGTHLKTVYDNTVQKHVHRNMADIRDIVNSLNTDDKVKSDAIRVYEKLAEAEAEVHRVEPEKVHFHEVGSLSSIADICAFVYLLNKLKTDEILCSPVHVGKGKVECAHGILPVPAPATAILLKDIPHYSKDIEGELCTPTAAAILKTFVSGFGDMPEMDVVNTAYGIGTRDFGTASYVRMILGTMN